MISLTDGHLFFDIFFNMTLKTFSAECTGVLPTMWTQPKQMRQKFQDRSPQSLSDPCLSAFPLPTFCQTRGSDNVSGADHPVLATSLDPCACHQTRLPPPHWRWWSSHRKHTICGSRKRSTLGRRKMRLHHRHLRRCGPGSERLLNGDHIQEPKSGARDVTRIPDNRCTHSSKRCATQDAGTEKDVDT
jgi:hypothetical protein